MVRDLYLFSDCGQYFVYCGPDGKLRIWDVISGVLKQEYVPNVHLNSPCSSIIWISIVSSTSDPSSPWKSKKRKLEDSEDKLIAFGTTSGSLALYSLSEGKVISTLKGGHSNPVCSLSWSPKEGLFSVANNEIVHWDISKKSVKRKWKCGKGSISCLAVSQSGEYCVTGSFSLMVWDLSNQQLIKKYTGHSSEVINIVFINNQYFLSCASADRHVSVWSTKGDYEEPIGRLALGECLIPGLSVFENNGCVHVGAPTKNGTLHYFNHHLNGKVAKSLKPCQSIEIAAEGNSVRQLPIVAARVSNESSATIVYGHSPFFNFENITLSDGKKNRVCLVRSANNKKSVNNNRVGNETSNDAEYISAGHLPKRKQGLENDVAMEERLRNLSIDQLNSLDPAVSTTHSPYNMANLLTQGLESNDRTILESVLFRKDPQIISETVSRLPISSLRPLIDRLVTMIEGKTFTSVAGCQWLKGVLREHSAQILADRALCGELAPLEGLVESRLGLLGPLRSLTGRMDHLLHQLDLGHQDNTLSNQQPALLFQDQESSDDGGSLLLDGESEAEDKWEELSDQQLDTDDAS